MSAATTMAQAMNMRDLNCLTGSGDYTSDGLDGRALFREWAW